jgi:hypothetical protein
VSIVNLDRFKSKRGQKTATPGPPQRPSRIRGHWAPVTLAELLDRRHDSVCLPVTRLLWCLRITSWRGQRPVRLTNEMAEAIGLDRSQKMRCLRRLEQAGYVSVDRSMGQQVPIVTMEDCC